LNNSNAHFGWLFNIIPTGLLDGLTSLLDGLTGLLDGLTGLLDGFYIPTSPIFRGFFFLYLIT